MRMDVSGKGMICFEGQILPEAAKHFELACFWPDLPDDIRTWGLDLHYAWARWREAPSELVLRGCEELEQRIYATHTDLLAGLNQRFSSEDAVEICAQWISAINLMRACAEKRPVCRWTISPQAGEVERYLGTVSRIVQSIIKTIEAKKLGCHSPDGWDVVSEEQPAVSEDVLEDGDEPFEDTADALLAKLEYLKTASEEEQIAFINNVTDTYSDPRS